jgi:hypothetical protein
MKFCYFLTSFQFVFPKIIKEDRNVQQNLSLQVQKDDKFRDY